MGRSPSLPRSHRPEALRDLVVEAAAEVRRRLGPALPDAAYRTALCLELLHRGVPFQQGVEVPVYYRGRRLAEAHRFDLVVAGMLAVDVAVTEQVTALDRASLRARVRIASLEGGVFLNFRATRIAEGAWALLRRGAAPATSADDDATTAGPPPPQLGA